MSQLNVSAHDTVLPFSVDVLDVRGRVVFLSHELDQLMSRHNYPEPVAAQLAEALTLTILVGSSMKFEGRFIVQSHTNGAIELMVCEYRSDGSIRGYVRFDKDAVELASAANLLGTGTLALTVDQGPHTERYQGIVAIEDGLEHAAKTYFKQSEQLPSEVKLGAGKITRNDNGVVTSQWVAGGLLAQHMPALGGKPRDLDDGRNVLMTDHDDNWIEASALIQTLADDELLDPLLGAERMIYRLFHEHGPTKFDELPIQDNCGCSVERIKVAMSGLSEEELSHVFEHGDAQVECEFCSTHYQITRQELANQ